MNLEEYLEKGVIAELGYRPTSSSIKPVHIANGLGRAAVGEHYDPKLLNHALVRWAKRGSEERHSTGDFAADAQARLGGFGEAEQRTKLNELRGLLRDVLGADGAVFDKNEYTSYSLTHRTHLTRDTNDRHTGEFIFRLLAADVGSGPSPTLGLLRDLLSDDTDEITSIAWPLTVGETPTDCEIDPNDRPGSLVMRSQDGQPTFRSPIVRELRAAFDRLARFEKARGSKLQSLRRIVLLSSVAIYLHLVHRVLDLGDGRSYKSRRRPMLLDFTYGGWTPTALASHGTYTLAVKSIEEMMVLGIRAALEQEYAQWTKRRFAQLVETLTFQGSAARQEQKRKQLLDVFNSYAAEANILDAAAFSIVDGLVDEMSGTPIDFARSLGVRSGLLAPRGNRAVKKRYAPSTELLETLLVATVDLDQDVELHELADALADRFNILVGARPGDSRDLSAWAINNAAKEDLSANASALREALIDMGYARRYADGVTVIRIAAGPRA